MALVSALDDLRDRKFTNQINPRNLPPPTTGGNKGTPTLGGGPIKLSGGTKGGVGGSVVQPIKDRPMDNPSPVPIQGTQIGTGTQAPQSASVPAGVNPRDWANPVWKAIWLKQHPDYKPTSGAPKVTGGPTTTTPAATTGTSTGTSPAPGTGRGQNVPYWAPKALDAYWQKPESYVSPQSTVQGQLSSILDSNSPLMKQAAAKGKVISQGKGYSSSTASTAVAMGAMINAALPIAQQDAATFARFAENEQTADIAKDMATYGHELTRRLDQMKIDSAEKQGMMSMFGSLTSNFMTMMDNVINNPKITNSDQVLNMYKDTYKKLGDLFASFIGGNVQWGGY